jgi:hypothetical protein
LLEIVGDSEPDTQLLIAVMEAAAMTPPAALALLAHPGK